MSSDNEIRNEISNVKSTDIVDKLNDAITSDDIDINNDIELINHISRGKKSALSSKGRWRLTEHNIRTDYPVIEDYRVWKAPSPPYAHPDSPIYTKFWSTEAARCIEGIWRKDFDKYRYMPGKLYFFYNYFIIEHTVDVDGYKETKYMRPYLFDYFWEIAYMDMCAYGFSGFESDTQYTCSYKVRDYLKGRVSKDVLTRHDFRPDGSLKEFVDPWEYLNSRHDHKHYGPLYNNPLKNYLILGTRGGGKSYWVASCIEHEFIFCGAKRYSKAFIENKLSSSTVVGSSETAKSSELLDKFKTSLDAKIASDNEEFKSIFGIYSYVDMDGNMNYIPGAFYRYSSGSLECPNKKNIFRAEYKKYINGEWKSQGSGSTIAHVNYSPMKGGNSGHRAAEGGRYSLVVFEEVGSMPNFVEALGANEGAVKRSGHKFGVQVGIGTSGNIKYIVSAKKVFLDPDSYDFFALENKFSLDGKDKKTCYFLPYYVTIKDCKDENGNTDYAKAIEFVNSEREKKAQSEDPRVLRDFLMNHPCFVHEMWFTDEGYFFPVEELMERERELMHNQTYKKIMLPVYLFKRPDGKVSYRILDTSNPGSTTKPIVDFPLNPNESTEGCVVIYEQPEPNHPPDMYNIIGYDPYVEEDLDKGGSIAATYIIKNPKYSTLGKNCNIIVASYIGKPKGGLKEYHRQQELLIEYYGNPPRSLWFENNRGEACVSYYRSRRKEYLFAIRYENLVNSKIKNPTISTYGFKVGTRFDKLQYINYLNEWLLQETTHVLEDGTEETKMNLYRIPCLFLIRQLIAYNLKDNFDAVSAMLGCALAIKQEELLIEHNIKLGKKRKLSKLLNNPKIFKSA